MKVPKTTRIRKTKKGKIKEFKIQFWMTEESIDSLIEIYPEYNTFAPMGNRIVSDCMRLNSLAKKERLLEEKKREG
jgi:hypothetical protein